MKHVCRLFLVLWVLPVWSGLAGEVQTVAGGGSNREMGREIPALQAALDQPFGIVPGPDGAWYFCEYGGQVVWRLDSGGKLTTIAGTGVAGNAGNGAEGGPALQAQLNQPHELAFDRHGRLYISDMLNHSIRVLDRKTGILSTAVGTGQPGFGGDGGPGRLATLKNPISQTFGPDGLLYICDLGNQRVRTWDPVRDIVTTVCGNGTKAAPHDGAAFSPETPLSGPRTIAFDPQGNLWLALRDANSLFKVKSAKGFLEHVAGTGKSGFAGNDGPAREAQLAGPKGLAIAPDGRVFIADTESHTIRCVDSRTGRITVAVGDGQAGSGPDGPALACRLNRPHGLFLQGNQLWIGDSGNHCLRILDLD